MEQHDGVHHARDAASKAHGRRPVPGVALIAALLAALPVTATGQTPDVAIPPGLNFGGSVGLNQFRGPEHQPLAGSVGWAFFIGGGMANGLYGRLGGLLSGQEVAPDTPDYQFLTLFAEPRYVLLGLSPLVAPFVAGRIGWTYEKVLGGSYNLKANGSLLAGGGGILFRAAPQIALEVGVLLGRARFDDYTFKGQLAWKECLDALEAGTSLPASVESCAGSRSFGGAIRLCYPPYFTEETGECEPPDIPYSGTGRSGSWLRAWVGVNLSLSTVLNR